MTAPSPQHAPMLSLPSLQAVYIELWWNDCKLSSGTAFVCETYAGTLLVSNWHNFSGRNSQTGRCISRTLAIPNVMRAFFHAEGNWDETLPIEIPILDSDGQPLWLVHPVHGQVVDVAAIPLPQITGVSLFPVSWRNPIPLAQRVGLPVKVIGYPFGYRINRNFPVWATGALASEPEIDVDNLPLMLIDCRTRRGNSGSPVVLHYPKGTMYPHEDGAASTSPQDVIRNLGIYSGRISVGSDIGRVWKLSAIVDILLAFEKIKGATHCSFTINSGHVYGASSTAA